MSGRRRFADRSLVRRQAHVRSRFGSEPHSWGSNEDFGVSVLTSFAEGELIGYDGTLSDLVGLLAKGACEWGMHGIVCSGHEVEKIKKIAPQIKCLTPGIRLG